MAAGKRYTESRLARTPSPGAPSGPAVHPDVPRFVWTLSATAMVSTYSLWAFEVGAGASSTWRVLSVIPFVLAVLRFAVDVNAGTAEAPDEIVVRDRAPVTLGGRHLAAEAGRGDLRLSARPSAGFGRRQIGSRRNSGEGSNRSTIMASRRDAGACTTPRPGP
jgi:hypothetical protein